MKASIIAVLFSIIVAGRVAVTLNDHRSNRQVFWDSNYNSYVVVKDESSQLTLAGEKVSVVSVNGAGEIRWSCNKQSQLRPGEGLEAAEYFGVIKPGEAPRNVFSDFWQDGAKVSEKVNEFGRYDHNRIFYPCSNAGWAWVIVKHESGKFTRENEFTGETETCLLVKIRALTGETFRVYHGAEDLEGASENCQAAAEFFDLGDALAKQHLL